MTILQILFKKMYTFAKIYGNILKNVYFRHKYRDNARLGFQTDISMFV